MELDLKKIRLDAFDTCNEATLFDEETAETIVPDFCPDIARIIDTLGNVFVHNQEFRDGKALISGVIRLTVLYMPDGESGIRNMEVSIPFSTESEHYSFSDCPHMIAIPELESAESRTLNPRKIFTQCKVVTHLTCFRQTSLTFTSDINTENLNCTVERKIDDQRAVLLTDISEKSFTFSDEFLLPSSRSSAAELLSNQVSCVVSECKHVGERLLLKGLCTIHLLYRTPDGKLSSSVGELPFSQVMEATASGEQISTNVFLQATGCDLQIGDSSDGRKILVTLYLHATALIWKEYRFSILSDLYSTTHDSAFSVSPVPVNSFHDTFTRRQTVREVLEIGVVADTIHLISARCGVVSVNRDDHAFTMRTAVKIQALYADEGGSVLLAERTVEVVCQTELPPECMVSAKAVCQEEIQGNVTDRGIEVRFPVDFTVDALVQEMKLCVSEAKLENPKSALNAPSLVLRRMGTECSVWDLAKQHNTTISYILAANNLEDASSVPTNQLLLIPRKRD